MFEVPCPIDLRLGFRFAENGQTQLTNLDGDQSSIRAKHLGQMLAVVNRREWRHPDRPLIQIVTPYMFVADEPVYLTQIPPIAATRAIPGPGRAGLGAHCRSTSGRAR